MEILDAILGGKADDQLDAIISAVRNRQQILVHRTVTAGATVIFNSHIRPAYLRGVEAEVVRVNQTTVTVKVKDASKGGKFGSQPFKCPITLLDLAA